MHIAATARTCIAASTVRSVALTFDPALDAGFAPDISGLSLLLRRHYL
jgi:hypothetical protein